MLYYLERPSDAKGPNRATDPGVERNTPAPRQGISSIPKARPACQDCRWWATCFMDFGSCFSWRLVQISHSSFLYWFLWQVVESVPSFILPTQYLQLSHFWNMELLEQHPYSPSWVLQSRPYDYIGNYGVSVLVSALTHSRKLWISIMPWVTKCYWSKILIKTF